jgi:hypothetical protein
MKPYGYIFNGKFYKTLEELRGRTMSDSNKPIPVYTEDVIEKAIRFGCEIEFGSIEVDYEKHETSLHQFLNDNSN